MLPSLTYSDAIAYQLECENLSSCPLSFPVNLSFHFRLSSADISAIMGNLEEISTFQQTLVQSLEDCTK